MLANKAFGLHLQPGNIAAQVPSITPNQMMDPLKPNFLIVGAAKAGTSSLWHWLRQHPQVFMPRDKEPGYFVHGYGVNNLEKYLSLFAAGQGKPCIGEATAAYLAAPESAPWIHDTLGKIKIIIILRNPIERAYSLYCWMVMEGYERIETFEEALGQESSRMASRQFQQNCPAYFADYFYFNTGLYNGQVEHYINIFGADSVKIYLFDELKANPEVLYTNVCDFLEISSLNKPAFVRQNTSLSPKSIPLQYRLRALRRQTEKRLGRFGKPAYYLCDMAMRINTASNRISPMSAAVKKQLAEMYRTDVDRTARLIRRDLSHWLEL
jgi:hypothetical protein